MNGAAEGLSSSGAQGVGAGGAAGEVQFVTLGAAGEPVLLPNGNDSLKGEFARDGFDLRIDLPSGETLVVVDFFAGGPDALPTLVTETGARLLGETAAKLAGPETAGQVAQSGGALSDAGFGEPVGSVDAMKGTATVIRADGTREELEAGSQIFENDTIVTGPDSALGVLFVDDSTMSMGAGARIVVDQMVYDDSSQTGSQLFDVVQGAFVFASGHIGKSNPEEVEVRTPVATIGIRGTKYGVNVGAESGDTTVTLFEGAVTVTNGGGQTVLSSVGQSTLVTAFEREPGPVQMMDPTEQARTFGDAIAFSPDQPPIGGSGQGFEDSSGGAGEGQAALDQAEIEQLAEQLNDLETAAGPSGAIAAVTQSAAFLRLLNGLLEGTGGLQSGALANDNFASAGGEDFFIAPTLRSDPLDEREEPAAPSDDLLSSPVRGNVTYSFDPTKPIVGSVTGSTDPGSIDLFTIDASQAQRSTDWTVGQDANGNVIITESGGTEITMDEVEELGIDFGAGDDEITIGDLSQTDIINETLFMNGGAGNDVIDAGATDKRLVADGGTGDDTISGGSYGDDLRGGAGDDVLNGGAGGDTLTGGEGADDLRGGEGADTLIGGAGDDTVAGGAGDDVIVYTLGDGADVIDGGAGVDRLEIRYGADDLNDPAVVSDLAALASGRQGVFEALGLTVSGVETVVFNGPAPDGAASVSLDASPGVEDEPTALTIDLDAPESPLLSIDVTLSGLPEGYSLVNAAGDSFAGGAAVTLAADQLEGLQIVAPENASAAFTLSVTATTTNLLTGAATSDVASAAVRIASVADDPIVTVADAVGVEARAGDDLIEGGDGADALTGGSGADTLIGGAGDDVLTGDGANGAAIAPLAIGAALGGDLDGSESLTITLSGLPEGVVITDADGTPYETLTFTAGELDGLQAVAPAGTGDFSVTVTTTVTDTDPDGGADTASSTQSFTVSIDGGDGPGDDVLIGGAGADTLIGGDGDDSLSLTIDPEAGQDSADGGAGADSLTLALTVGPIDLLDPDIVADLVDLADWIAAEPGVDEARTFEALGLRVQNIESLTIIDLDGQVVEIEALRSLGVVIEGGDEAEVLTGGDNPDQISGGGGDDVIDGGAGDDVIDGGAGDDVIFGGAGGDTLMGGDGADTITGDAGADVIEGGAGDDVLAGGGGADTISGGDGDDVATFNVATDGPGTHFDGGDGLDVLRIELSSGLESFDQALADIAAAIKAAKTDPEAAQSIDSIGLSFENVEDVQLYVDGEEKQFAPTVSGLDPIDIDTDELFAGAPVARGVSITDADSPTLMQASVSIASGYQDGDALIVDESVLQATGLTVVAAGSDQDGGFTLTLAGDAPIAAYEEAIAAIRLISDDPAPAPGARVVSVTVIDDEGAASEAAEAPVGIEAAPPAIKDADGADNDSAVFVTAADATGAVVSDLEETPPEPQTRTETLTLTVARAESGAHDDDDWGGGDDDDWDDDGPEPGQYGNGKFEVIVNGISLGVFTAAVALGQVEAWQTINIPGIPVTEGETVDIEVRAFNNASNVLVNRIELGDRILEAESDAVSLDGAVEGSYVSLAGGGSVGFSIAIPAPESDAFDSWLLETPGGEQALAQDDLDQLFDGVDMGAGQDWAVAAAGVASGLSVDLTGPVWSGVEHVAGGAGDDVLVGGDGANILAGADGDDRIVAGGSDDLLLGGAGDDSLEVSGDDLSGMGGAVDYGDRPSGVDAALDANSLDSIDGLDGGFSGVDGGSGFDVLRVTAGPSDGVLDGDDLSAVRNIEALDLVGDDGSAVDINLSLEDVVSMTDDDNELTILKGQESTVTIGDQQFGAGEHQLSLDGMLIKLTIADGETPPDQV